MNLLGTVSVLFVFFGCEPQLFAQTTPVDPPPPPATAPAVVAPVPAFPKIELQPEWSGDLRYRLVQVKEAADEPRPYQQLRARLQVKADVNPQVKGVIRLATATSAISANQTLGDSRDPGFARRSFGLDIAMMSWSAFPELTISLGKVTNPYFSAAKNQLVFDSDLNFEGLAVQSKLAWGPSEFFVNAGAFVIAENYDSATRSDVVDIGVPGFDLGYHQDFGFIDVTVHYANQYFVNIQDAPINSLDKNAKYDIYSIPFDSYRGNTIYTLVPGDPPATRKYQMMNKYVLEVAGFELKSKLSVVDVTAFAEFVKNREVGSNGSGHEMGLNLKWGRSQIGVAKIRKEADSVVAAFCDSNANGGGTDADGQRVSLRYQLSKNSQWALNQFTAKRGISTVEREFSLTQVDFLMNF